MAKKSKGETIIISSDISYQAARTILQMAYEAGSPITMSIEPYTRKKTSEQLNTWWAILRAASSASGNSMAVMEKLARTHTLPTKMEIVKLPGGEIQRTEVRKSISELDIDEMRYSIIMMMDFYAFMTGDAVPPPWLQKLIDQG